MWRPAKNGVDALAFTASASIGPNDILWLTKECAKELHFANDGTEVTTAELNQVQGEVYLKVQQKQTGFSSRFLFTCAGGKMRLMGGLVTNPQDAKQKYDWATKSFFTFDARTIQEMPKRRIRWPILNRGIPSCISSNSIGSDTYYGNF